jgi:hypothetical protein
MNRNYQAGVRFEREIVHEREAQGEIALRTAGSRGFADVVAIVPGVAVDFVQCKVTKSEAQANRLCEQFKKDPPLPLGPYRQVLEVKVVRKGRKTVIIERASPPS